MIVVMNPRSSREHIDQVVRLLDNMGVSSCVIDGATPSVIELLEVNGQFDRGRLESAPMVDRVLDRPVPMLAMDRAAGDGATRTREVPLGAGAILPARTLVLRERRAVLVALVAALCVEQFLAWWFGTRR